MGIPITKKKPCLNCGDLIPPSVVIDGVRRSMDPRKYCLKCSPFGEHNNRQLEKERHDGLKTCAGPCGKDKPVTEFSKRDGICKKCLALKTRTKRRETKLFAVRYLGGKCIKCGYNKCLAGFDFHHRKPSEKDFEIGRMKWRSIEELIAELDKCDLMCRNCHAEEHDGDHLLCHLIKGKFDKNLRKVDLYPGSKPMAIKAPK